MRDTNRRLLEGGAKSLLAFAHVLLDLLLRRNIPGDLGSAGYFPCAIPNRGNGERYDNAFAIFAQACRFVAIDRAAATHDVENLRHVVRRFRWHQYRDRMTDRFFRRVSEDTRGAPVPARNHAIQILAYNGVVGVFDDRSQARIRLAGARFVRAG